MKPQLDNPPGEAGFTLIETIVALVILAAALLAFYEFLASSLHAADRVRHAAEAYDRRQNALALATKLNPMATPEGTLDLGSYRLHWRAERISTPQRSTEYPSGSEGAFTVALFRVVIDFPDDHEFAPVELTKLGHHRETRPAEPSGNL